MRQLPGAVQSSDPAYSLAELEAKQSSVTPCLCEFPALRHKEGALLSLIQCDSHFEPRALLFSLPGLNLQVTLHGHNYYQQVAILKCCKRQAFLLDLNC